MVKVCCVKHCNNRSTRESDRRYFSIPGTSKSTDDYTEKVNRLTALRRAKWIDAIRGQNVDDVWLEKGSEFVCSDHFQSGEPAEIENDSSIDWVPTLRMGHAEVGHEPEELEDTGNRWRNWETFVRRIMVYIKSGSHDEDLTKSEQRAILKAAKTYYLEGGVLFHQRSGKPLRVVMLEADHKAVIRRFHLSEFGIHSGINTTIYRISSKFFWRGIKQDVVQYIGQCCGNQRGPKDSTKLMASKPQEDDDDDCSSASEDESSKADGGLGVVSEIMTASSAIQKIADTISKQKSSKPRTRSQDSSEQQCSTHTSTVETDVPGIEESKEGRTESKEGRTESKEGRTEAKEGRTESKEGRTETGKQDAEEVLILDENEGTFVKVDRKLVVVVENDPMPQVPLVDLTSSEAAQSKRDAPTQAVIIRKENNRPDLPDETILDGLSASTTILKLVNNATKERAENQSLKMRGQNPWPPKQRVRPRHDILARPPPVAPAVGSTKSPAKADPDGKAPPTKIYRSVAWSLYNIGLKMVRQQVYKELVEIQELKDEQKRLDEGEQKQLEKLKGYYMDLRMKNRYLMAPGKRCRCGYRVTSRQELELHLEYGHGWESGRYDCCLCKFTSKAFALFSSHMVREHGRKARCQQPLAAFVCPFCPFEHRHNTKKKLLRHIANCESNFQLDCNLAVRAIDSDIPILAPPKPVVSTTPAESASTTPQTTKSQASKNQRSLLKTPSAAEGNVPAVSANSIGNLPLKVQQQPTQTKAVAYEICEVCGGFTKDRTSLISHLRTAHNVDIYPVCAKIPDLPIACKFCPERFWTPIGLERHISLQHSLASFDLTANAVISVCPLCKRTRLTDVMLHLAQQHRVTLLDMFSVRYCALCLTELHSEKAFEDHMTTRHPVLYPRRSVLLESIRALEQARPFTSRPTSAILLALVSRNKYKYGASRAPLQMYSCPICRCHYGSLDDLTNHFERIHPLKCCRCEYRCKSAEMLWRHFRAEHEVTDLCPICQQEMPAGQGTIEHFEKYHLKSCTVTLSPFSEIEELQVKGRHAHYMPGKRHHPSSLGDGSDTDTVSGDEATERKSPKLSDLDDNLVDLNAPETC